MAGHYEQAIFQRLMDIDWHHHDAARQGSQLALFQEYLRRVGVWCIALDWHEAHPIVSDFPQRICPEVSARPVNTTLVQQTMRTVGQTSIYARMLATRMLNMAAIVDARRDDLPYGLQELYAPLLLFYERGGWLEKSTGKTWLVSGREMAIGRAHTYANKAPLDMSESFDGLDVGV